MGKIYASIDKKLAAFITRQPVYFVGTAPLAGDGHINLSPKGMGGTFAVLSPTTVAYLDYTGSGVETMAHLAENGRIVIMFCAFDGAPNIVRLHGRGRAVPLDDPEFEGLRVRFSKPDRQGERSVVVVELDRISDSCGYAVPKMDFVEDRDVLDRSNARRSEEYFRQYRADKNAESIDGLPGFVR